MAKMAKMERRVVEKLRGSLKVLSVRGVELKLHFSLIFLLAYVVLIASIQFPAIVRQSGLSIVSLRLGPWLSGLIFALGLFLSVALHEFGHVWVAQAFGVRVRGITLMMLGGISEMERAPEEPFAEFKLAVIGPLVSLALAGILFILRTHVTLPEVKLFAYWIGNANLVLAIFNLLPIFPLDGGRALRSILAVKSGQARATDISARISRVCSWLLGVWGFWTFNIILVMIAFFIYNASQAELNLMNSRGLLRGIKVSEIINRIPPIHEKVPLGQAATEMRRLRSPILPVVFDSGHIGLLSLEKLKAIRGENWFETSISEISEPANRILKMSDFVSDVLSDLLGSPLRALPVVDEGNVVGIVKYTDVVEALRYKSIEEPSLAPASSEGKRSA